MQTEYLIDIDEFCNQHSIEVSFIVSLQRSGLIETTIIEAVPYIHEDQLPQLERFVRFYYELNINVEGIETVSHLLQRVSNLQQEIIALKNRLRLYE